MTLYVGDCQVVGRSPQGIIAAVTGSGIPGRIYELRVEARGESHGHEFTASPLEVTVEQDGTFRFEVAIPVRNIPHDIYQINISAEGRHLITFTLQIEG